MLQMKMFSISAAAKHNKHISLSHRVTLASPNLRINPRIPQITAGPVILPGVFSLNPTYEPFSQNSGEYSHSSQPVEHWRRARVSAPGLQ